MRTMLLAIAVAATAAIAIPVIARSADQPDTLYAQAGPMGRHWGGDDGGGEAGRHDWPMMHGMMIRHMMMHRDPQERCTERLAMRAAMRAYAEAKLNLTAEQRPLWDKVQSAAQAEEQKERQLCTGLKAGAELTLLDRMDRMQQFLSTRLEGLQSAKPSVQALYQALTPEQRTILDHSFRR